jgi:hypothetical protein
VARLSGRGVAAGRLQLGAGLGAVLAAEALLFGDAPGLAVVAGLAGLCLLIARRWAAP